jgi:hypothetical protein
VLCASQSWYSAPALNHRNETMLMMVAAAFFDESTDETTGARCYTVAGFLGPLEECLMLDLAWGDFLQRIGVSYFKTSQCEYGFGEFAKFRDDPNDLSRPFSKREKDLFTGIKISAVDVIMAHPEMYGVGSVLLLPDYHRLTQEYERAAKVLPRPYYLCSTMTLMESGQMMNKLNAQSDSSARGYLRPVFDSHEEYSGVMKQGFDGFCKKNPLSSKYLLAPHYEDERTYLCLQAADVLAYESRRTLVGLHYENRAENKAMARLKKKIWRLYKVDYAALRVIADAQELPDVIPIPPAIQGV